MTGLAERLGFSRPSSIGFTSEISPSAIRHCAELWRRLPRRNGAPRQEVVPSREIGDTSGVECPAHTAVGVAIGIGADRQTARIHANVISFDSGRQAVAGQSPQAFAFTEKFLVQGLDSGNGLFQFVDPMNHRIDPITRELIRPRSERTLLGQLLNRWQKAVDEQEPLVLAGRYEVSGIAEHQTDDTHARYSMTAMDRQNGNRTVTVPLTQAALPFENNRLRADQIEQANALLESHRNSYQPLMESETEQVRHDPAILSKKGIGRNAALITYREVLAKIAEEGNSFNLLNALEEVVTKERFDCGKDFLHSENQLEEVHAALSKYLGERQQANQSNQSNQAKFSWLSPRRRRPAGQFDEVKEEERKADPMCSAPNSVAAVTAETPVVQPVDHRANILALLQEHAADNPLQLFSALADENSHIAAFCAIQARRALTPIAGTNSGGYEHTSMHDGVSVEIITSESAGVFSEPSIGFEVEEEDDEPPQSISLQELLIHDLEKALPAADAEADKQIKTDPFPQGLASALQSTHRNARAVVTPPAEKLSVENVARFFTDNADAPPLELMEILGQNNPSLTSLIHFIEHALLLRDSHRSVQCERYDYVPGNAEEETFFTKSHNGSGQKHFPTFIAGVDRTLYARHEKWQIEVDGQRHLTNCHAEVYQYVIGHTLRDLQSTKPRSDSPGLFPLPVYKLLAKAIGLPQIPPYLHEHEAALIETTSKNQVDVKHSAHQAKQAHVEKEQKIEQEKQRVAQETARRYAELGVRNGQEEFLLGQQNYQNDLLSRSVDMELALPAQAVDSHLLENFKQDLLLTHYHQAVSSRFCSDPTTDDHLSWLRSSWISLFEMLTPQQLADGLRAMEKNPGLIEHDARLLQLIAEHYRQNPAAFLQGKAVNGIDDPAHVIPRHAAFNYQAVLGTPLPLNQVLHCKPGDQFRIPDYCNIEDFLLEKQLTVAMAYRAQYQGIEGELAGLLGTPGPARSALPIALHRAFGVPLLLVEKSASAASGNDAAVKSMGRLRVAALTDSDMAKKFAALKDHTNVDEDVMTSLAIDVSTTPVIWREGKHYSIYMPKPPESDAVPFTELAQLDQLVNIPSRSSWKDKMWSPWKHS